MTYDINERQIGTLTHSLNTILDADSLDTLETDALVAIIQLARTLTAIQTDAQRQCHMEMQRDSRQTIETLKESARLMTQEQNATLAEMRKLRTQLHELRVSADSADDFNELISAGLLPAASE